MEQPSTEIAPRSVIVTDIIFFSLSTCVIFSIQRKFYLYLLARLSTVVAFLFYFIFFHLKVREGGQEKIERGELRCDGLDGVYRGTRGTAGLSACICRAAQCACIALQSPRELKSPREHTVPGI